jgi:D-sedoheptulose 7-phosphate isomerase
MNQISKHLSEVSEAMSFLDMVNIQAAVNILKRVKMEGAAVYLIGNGGSAATCSHFANDLVKMCHIRAYSIPDMTVLTLAMGNDGEWFGMFYDTIRRLKQPRDIVIAITCSGESENITSVLYELINSDRILLTGPADDSSALRTEPDVVIKAMAQDITIQEDIHLMVCHAICKELMYG